jgi:hypothetical protein
MLIVFLTVNSLGKTHASVFLTHVIAALGCGSCGEISQKKYYFKHLLHKLVFL